MLVPMTFVRTFAEGLLQRAGLRLSTDEHARTLRELEQAVQQRIGIAVFDQLGKKGTEEFMRDFEQTSDRGAAVQQIDTRMVRGRKAIQQELAVFAAEFLKAAKVTQ